MKGLVFIALGYLIGAALLVAFIGSVYFFRFVWPA